MKNPSKYAHAPSDRARELRTELASKIASFMGSEENLATDIFGLTPFAECAKDEAHSA
jgi:hypothetical protein